MTKDEALKLALEALETNNKAWKHLADSGDAGFWEAEEQPFYEMSVKAITAIKEALAQPEQEPVAFMFQHDEVGRCVFSPNDSKDPVGTFLQLNPRYHLVGPLYTTPPQRTWVGLTQEELSEIYNRTEWDTVNGWEYERAIEAALRSKNK